MLKIQRAELRNSWPAWLGVSIVFLVLSLVFVFSALTVVSGFTAVANGEMVLEQSGEFTLVPLTNFVLGGIVGLGVVSSSVSLVIDCRRGALARLALAGATPGQVLGTVLGQLAAVTLACALIADVICLATLGPGLNLLAAVRTEPDMLVVAPTPVHDLGVVLLTNLLTVGFALLAGLGQARRASRIPPVEALRQAEAATSRRRVVLPVLGAVTALLVTGIAFGMLPVLAQARNKETASNVMQLAIAVLLTTTLAFASVAHLYVGHLARFWTGLIPVRSASWQIARRNVSRRGARFARSVTPVMFTVAILLGMTVVMPTIAATTAAAGYEIQLSGAGIGPVLTMVGPALAIALAGGVGSLLMMSKQRDAELALTGVLGATPGQRRTLPVLEAVIIAVTALFPALIAVGVELAYFHFGLPAAGYAAVLSVPWGSFVGAFVVTLLITIAATFLPTLPALRKPERQVLARLAAE
ncbi:FtsX-like permease family protein [Granulicoccus phenolivorans]|uniref:FtsX-like permease family protein n=1 Tax=Granulicoccus phenolivorans TaxID=266854 RepID=UPI000402D8EF|nr:FtsX-like permease family protein [Granulicoccus phenolivorans]